MTARLFVYITLLVLLGLHLAGPGSARGQQGPISNVADRMPTGEGKEIAISACSPCHSLAQILANRMDEKAWRRVVDDMISRGLKMEPDETGILVEYLGAYFGPLVNINKASAAELATLPSVGRKLADAIERYRQRNGEFKKIEDIAKVEGLTPEILGRIKARLTLGATSDTKAKKSD